MKGHRILLIAAMMTVSAAGQGDPWAARSTTIPRGLRRATGKGWFTILRLYSPKESFFDKTWRLSEIEPVK